MIMAEADGHDNAGFEPGQDRSDDTDDTAETDETAADVTDPNTSSDTFPSEVPDTVVGQLPRPTRVRRSITDVQKPLANRAVINSDVIIEDDYDVGKAEPIRQTRPSQKKTTVVARHHTEVLRKRTVPPSQPKPVEAPEVQVTRRSLSKHGSISQATSRSLFVGDDVVSDTTILKSRVSEEYIGLKKKLTNQSNKRLQIFKHMCETRQPHVHTRELDYAKKTVESKHVVLISGSRGSGKTHTALKLVETLTRTHQDTPPMILNSSRDLRILSELNSKTVVLVDDFLGRFRLMDECVAELESVCNNLHYLIKHNKIFLILTCNEDFLTDVISLKSSTFLDTIQNYDCLVELNRDKCKLSKDEKVKLVKTIGKQLHSSFKSSDMDRLVSLDVNTHGFPILCWLVSLGSTADDLEESVEFCLHTYLENLMNTKIREYIVLVLVLVFDGRLTISKFDAIERSLLDKVAALFDIDEDMVNEATLRVGAKHLEGKYLTKGDTGYRITHDTFVEALVTHLLTNHDDNVIKILPIEILVSFPVRHSTDSSDGDVKKPFCDCILRPKHYKTIADRFKECLSMNLPDVLLVSSCELWDDAAFSDMALTVIGVDNFLVQKQSQTTLLSALCQSNRAVTVEKVIDYITQYRQDIIKERGVHLKAAIQTACRYKRVNIVGLLVNSVDAIADGIMAAAAEGGEYDIIQLLVSKGGQIHDRTGECIRILCKCGHTDTARTILDNKDGAAMLQRKGHKGNTLLHSAVLSPDTRFVEELINKGADPKVCNREGLSTLHVSANYGRFETLELLCERFPDLLNMTDNNGFTAAHYAAREGHLDVVTLLINLNVLGSIKIVGSNTILHLAAYNGHTEILRFLWKKYPPLRKAQNNESFTAPQVAARMGNVDTLQACIDVGVSPDSKTVDGRTFLHLGAFNGHLELCKHLCHRYPQLIEITDTDGNTVAHDAAASGSIKVVDFLLQSYVSIKALSKDECSVLHDACYYGRQEVGEYLINKCPELLHLKTAGGYTPCHGAALGGFVELFKVLVAKGADHLALSNDNSTVLHEAAFSGKFNMIKYLYTSYPELMHYRNNLDYTAIHFAAQEGHLEVFKDLLAQTNDPKSTTGENQTFLHIAAYNSRFEVVKYLCENYPALIMFPDSTNATALHYAARGGNIDICNYLIERMEDTGMKTSSGSTILHLACYDGKLDLVKYLVQHYPSLIELLDGTGHNAAHYAAGSNSVDLLKFVLDSGLDPRSRTDNGSTILLKAAYNGKEKMVRYILTAYPDIIRLTDTFECNLAHYAVCAGNLQVLQYALGSNIDPMGQTGDGHTLLHIAAFHGQIHLVKYICETYPEMLGIPDNKNLLPEHYAKEGQQDQVLWYFTTFKRQVSIASTSASGDHSTAADSENGGLTCGTCGNCSHCETCQDCLITCFRCGCTSEYALNVINRVWRGCIGLVCVCRR